MLGNFFRNVFSPVDRCCCTDDNDGACRKSMGRNDANWQEILEDMPSAPSTVELLIDSKNMRCATSAEALITRAHLPASLPRGPSKRTVPTYIIAAVRGCKLKGPPLFSGNVLRLRLGESIDEVCLRLYGNGFCLTPIHPDAHGEDEPAICRAWSPFSLIEKCQVKAVTEDDLAWAVFKLTVFQADEPDSLLYLASTGHHAFEERDCWLGEMRSAVNSITMSLFPPHAINVQPVPSAPTTKTRIMAGYLLQCNTNNQVLLVYGELHSYSNRSCRLALYEDEWCDYEVNSYHLEESSVVSSTKGIYCTCFGIDGNRFAARTEEEKTLWMRAVCNIKVKLMFDAPEPTEDDLLLFRDAVRERIDMLEQVVQVGNGSCGKGLAGPLLTPSERIPDVKTVRGDILNPEPIDDAAECSPQPMEDNEQALQSDEPWLGLSIGPEDLDQDDLRAIMRSISRASRATDDSFATVQVAGEEPGVNRTVHYVSEVLQAPARDSLDEPSEDTDAKKSWPAGARERPLPPSSDQFPISQPDGSTHMQGSPSPMQLPMTPLVPLLAWSPGRRKATQCAI